MDKQKILMIDDDKKLCRLVAAYLSPLGYEVVAVHNGKQGAQRAVSEEAWHAVILDVMLPEMDGFDVLCLIRAKSDVPVLMLTARGEETDRIVGLEIGADDYLPKTFSTRELLARLRAVTRRQKRSVPAAETLEEIVVGPLHIFPEQRRVVLGDESLTLTPVEFDLLLCLARCRGRVRSRDQLLEDIRQRNYEVFDRSIDVHISSLRRKLGDDAKNPRFIRTYRSAGYMLSEPEDTP